MGWLDTKSDGTFPHKKTSIFGSQHKPKESALSKAKESPRMKHIRETNAKSKENSMKMMSKMRHEGKRRTPISDYKKFSGEMSANEN